MGKIKEPFSDQVFHEILAFLRASRQYGTHIMNARGIKPRDLSVLRFLMEQGPASVSQIQGYVHLSPSTTSALISQLETKGFVTRARSTADNRVVIVDLTPTGKDMAENTPLGGLPLLRRKLAALPIARLEQINSAIKEIFTLMEDHREE